MNGLTKVDKLTLRELGERVWDLDAARTLGILDAAFITWRAGAMPHAALLEAIHHFHQKEARQLWTRYQSDKPESAVEIGLIGGLITLDDLPEHLRPHFRQCVPRASAS